jgi:formylglycine-generating enzyme required for sulfatase activity
MRCFHLFHGRWSRLSVLSVAAGALATVASMAAPSFAGTITFGSVGNTFNMEFVTIGNTNNAADTTGNPNPAGAVGYEYGIGKFEVSEDMITKYNANFGTANNLVITKDTRGTDKPATSVSWNEAARFVNWLNTSTGNQAAYKFASGSGITANIELWTSGEAGYDVNNKYRNSLAKYVLPSYNEWYKAAYYDPNKSGGAGYWNYATGSDSVPTAVTGGTTAGTAVYGHSFNQGPADVNNAGGLSPYSVMGLGGNAWEWEETSFSLNNDNGSVSSYRGLRGGDWNYLSFNMSSSARDGNNLPSYELSHIGFRVASLPSSAAAVPEPSMMVIGTLFGIGGLMAKRRMKK